MSDAEAPTAPATTTDDVDAPAADRPVARHWPPGVLGSLQKLSCQQRLYALLERHLGRDRLVAPDELQQDAGGGAPPKAEDAQEDDEEDTPAAQPQPERNYSSLARMLMAKYEEALTAAISLRHRNSSNDSSHADDDDQEAVVADDAAAPAAGEDAELRAFTQSCFVAVMDFLQDPADVALATPDIAQATHQHVSKLIADATSEDAAYSVTSECDDWPLGPALVREACELIHACMTVDIAGAVKQGAHQLELDASIARETAAAARENAERALQEGVTSIKINSGDRYIISQLARVGMDHVVRDELAEGAEEVDETEAIEIDVRDDEPRFLRGKLPRRRRTNYYFEARREQDQALREQTMGWKQKQQLNQARRALDGEDRLSRLTSMERAAIRQTELARERRMLKARERRIQAERDAAAGAAPGGRGGGGPADGLERTTRDAQGFLSTELDERVEEQGIRGKRDLPVGALPPWMVNKGAGRGDTSERDEITWGINTTLTIAEQRARLPIAQHRQRIVDTIKKQSITVLVGETGSGKTTQLAQYLDAAGLGKNGLIGCTQPRRVAATSLAERVATEYGCRVGEEVGYTVRFMDETSKLTKIKFLTDGMLLREALGDSAFSNYSVIILDEAHERSLQTDILFGLVKAAAEKRGGDLKVVVTSATLDIDRFCAYFKCEEPLVIPGRTHPVQIEHAEVAVLDYVEETVKAVMNIHLEGGPGDILCFLTGQDEIETVAAKLDQIMTSDIMSDAPPLLITVIYGALPQENQSLVFEKTPRGSRKVVLATNIAETSITINDLYFVVECGFCKQNTFDPRTGVEELKIVPISQQQAKQRAGRAGRTGPGKCIRLYTEEQFGELPAVTIPEIRRVNLINVVLTLKATGVDDLFEFDFLDPPQTETLVAALEKLYFLGALDADGVPTKIGSRMSELPLDPTQSKTLLAALDYGCASTVLTIVSMLSTPNVFYRPRDRADEADMRKSAFTAPEGDQLTLLNVYNEWIAEGATIEWCKKNFVHHRALRDARDVRTQLETILSRRAAAAASVQQGDDAASRQQQPRRPVDCLGPEQSSRDATLVRKALAAGYFFQAAQRTMQDEYRAMMSRRRIAIHPSSALMHAKPRYVIYHELTKNQRTDYMRYVMAIDPRWLVQLAPNLYSRPAPGQLSKAQRAERLAPKLKRHEEGNEWRISKVRLQMRR